MIFRRIKAHVEKENWFAVGVDFFIVVVGVFIGIQVANLNDRLSDRQRAENYRERLVQEMEINHRTLASRLGSYEQQIEYGLSAISA